jgi:hypothetical protein
MSNHLAIAGVTAGLVQLLDEVVAGDVPGAHVIAGRPDVASVVEAPPKVLIFLYRVEPNAAWRNEDLPTRGADGATSRRPQAALTLQYLFTFVGDEADYTPQRMLASVAGTLHFHPLLSREEIGRLVEAALAQDPDHALAALDLGTQPDLVRITPVALSLDDLSTLWSSFVNVDYRLSVAYQAETVLLTPPSAPVVPLPVRERRLMLSTIRRPALQRVVAAAGPAAPIVAGGRVRLQGRDLYGDEITVIRFGQTETTPSSVTATDLTAVVPAGVRAGAVPVVVEHRRLLGEPPMLRPAGQSNVVPVVVHPTIRRQGNTHLVALTDLASGPPGLHRGTVAVTVDPAVAAGQEVSVLLDPVDGGPGFTFFDDRRDAEDDPADTHELAIAFTGLPAGGYLVRVVVSGAQSPLDTAVSGPRAGSYVGPLVDLP